jgi:hypothetical protein
MNARVNVRQLRECWEALEKGQSRAAIPLFCMPPWYDVCSDLDWEMHLDLLDGSSFGNTHHGYCGVYRLIGLQSSVQPATISRACGQDRTGTLYIGQAGDLSMRLNQLRRTLISRTERSHKTAHMLRITPLRQFLPDKLAVSLLFTGTNTARIENDLILAYINTFGDTPPLNYKVTIN